MARYYSIQAILIHIQIYTSLYEIKVVKQPVIVLLSLPDDTKLFPGPGPATTVSEERAHNPFF